ncbi:MAG TPA: transglutaminase-like cysteine peptidase [Hyphomicrobiaceae bacterium]|nr:transglutaminase-like cysteine peptidase [Hyphomicrobiaceae bacterium]
MRSFSVLVALGAVVLFGQPGHAKPVKAPTTQDSAAAFLRVYGVTQPPHGFVEFCNRETARCLEGASDDLNRPQHDKSIGELVRINKAVNAEIEPATDLEVYGRNEFWTLPVKRGDCEDYALLKRQRLMAAGWPRSSLLMTVVLDEKGEGHAVLTARTSEGDFVLDNKTDDIKLWSKTPYQFVMRQSYLNARVWMSLDPTKAVPSVPVAGLDPAR